MLQAIKQSAAHPSEIAAMFRLKFGGYAKKPLDEPLDQLAKQLSDIDFCYETLNKVSRSFAVVIQQLPVQLKDPTCVFYLVLRGLDSVEDDMTFPNAQKIPLLLDFHNKLLEDGWTISGVGDGPDYRILLAHFDKVIRVFKGLDGKYQQAIKDITMKMGKGMAEYAVKLDGGKGSMPTTSDYNLYCHYVAGLVGWGLSDLFSVSGLEDPSLRHQQKISNSMGLFLQKTNIIRDYLEDMEQGRTWWPKDIWGLYGPTLESFATAPTSKKSLACLNHMVTDAMTHVPDCLEYISQLRDPKVFQFCAIPQVMAIATLATVYNNPNVFTQNVKIRKGLSAKLMLESNSIKQVQGWFNLFSRKMAQRIPHDDPTADRMAKLVSQAIELAPSSSPLPQHALQKLNSASWLMCLVAVLYLVVTVAAGAGAIDLVGVGRSLDVAVYGFFALAVAYLFGAFGMSYVE